MKKLFAAILLVCSACASSQTPRPQTVADNNQTQQPSVVDMVQYAPVRPANQQPVDIRAIVGNDTARQAGALQVPMFEPNSRDAVRPFVTGPWRGTCLNEAAINHIAVSVNQTVSTVRADDFRTLEILGANAQRDISLLQSDINILRLAYEAARGTSVLMAAGDTFRAAAAEQLQVWAERSGASFVRGAEGGDPASVIFDGIQSAAAKGVTLVLGDTAGRLQNKSNLMEELKKVRRVADKAPGTVNEVLLVIDATTGQNGLSQAKEFAAATDVTGVVLTKLDGSAKGGIVFAIETDLGIPVKLVGLGESAEDLVVFDPAEFVAALFE